MPEVVVRKRLGRRSGTIQYKLKRWGFHNRSLVAIILSFAAAGVTALGLWTLSTGALSRPDKGAETNFTISREPGKS